MLKEDDWDENEDGHDSKSGQKKRSISPFDNKEITTPTPGEQVKGQTHGQANKVESKDKKKVTEADKKRQIMIKLKRKQVLQILGLSLLSTLLFAASFLALGYSSHSKIMQQLQEESTNSNSTIILEQKEIYTFPFYSEKLIFSSCSFIVSSVFIIVQAIINYRNRSSANQNEFYTTNFDTFKTLHIFYCLFAGILLQLALMSIFYAWFVSQNLGLTFGVNTTMLTLIVVFLLIFHYLIYGKKVNIVQLTGAFTCIIGVVVLTMAICKDPHTNTGLIQHYNVDGLKVIGFSLLATVLIGFIIHLLQKIRLEGRIKFSTALSVIMFFDGLCSLIVFMILMVLGRVYLSITLEVQSSTDQYSLVKSKLLILIGSGVVFAIALFSISSALNQRPFSRFYSLLLLVPVPLLFAETLIEGRMTFNTSELISMCTLLIGALLIILAEPRHQYPVEEETMQEKYNEHLVMLAKQAEQEQKKKQELERQKQLLREKQEQLVDPLLSPVGSQQPLNIQQQYMTLNPQDWIIFQSRQNEQRQFQSINFNGGQNINNGLLQSSLNAQQMQLMMQQAIANRMLRQNTTQSNANNNAQNKQRTNDNTINNKQNGQNKGQSSKKAIAKQGSRTASRKDNTYSNYEFLEADVQNADDQFSPDNDDNVNNQNDRYNISNSFQEQDNKSFQQQQQLVQQININYQSHSSLQGAAAAQGIYQHFQPIQKHQQSFTQSDEDLKSRELFSGDRYPQKESSPSFLGKGATLGRNITNTNGGPITYTDDNEEYLQQINSDNSNVNLLSQGNYLSQQHLVNITDTSNENLDQQQLNQYRSDQSSASNYKMRSHPRYQQNLTFKKDPSQQQLPSKRSNSTSERTYSQPYQQQQQQQQQQLLIHQQLHQNAVQQQQQQHLGNVKQLQEKVQMPSQKETQEAKGVLNNQKYKREHQVQVKKKQRFKNSFMEEHQLNSDGESQMRERNQKQLELQQICRDKQNIADLISRLKEFSPKRLKQQVSNHYDQEILQLRNDLEDERNLRKQLEHAIAQLCQGNSSISGRSHKTLQSRRQSQEGIIGGEYNGYDDLNDLIQHQNAEIMILKQQNDELKKQIMKLESFLGSMDLLQQQFNNSFKVVNQVTGGAAGLLFNSRLNDITSTSANSKSRDNIFNAQKQINSKLSSMNVSLNQQLNGINPPSAQHSFINDRTTLTNLSSPFQSQIHIYSQQNSNNNLQQIPQQMSNLQDKCDHVKGAFKKVYEGVKYQLKTSQIQLLQHKNLIEEQQREQDRLRQIAELKVRENEDMRELYENQSLRIDELNQEIENITQYFEIERMQRKQSSANNQSQAEKFKRVIDQKDQEIGGLKKDIEIQQEQIKDLKEHIENLKLEIKSKETYQQSIQLQSQEINNLHKVLQDKEKQLYELKISLQASKEAFDKDKDRLERKVSKYSGRYKHQLKQLLQEAEILKEGKRQQEEYIKAGQETIRKMEKKYQQDISLFRMENLRKDEIVEQLKMKHRKYLEMIQTKIRHLLYRSRELLIPMGGQWMGDVADRREEDMVRGFNEVLEVLEKQLNPMLMSLSPINTSSIMPNGTLSGLNHNLMQNTANNQLINLKSQFNSQLY